MAGNIGDPAIARGRLRQTVDRACCSAISSIIER